MIGNLLSQVNANQLTDKRVKKILDEGEDFKIRARLDALRNNTDGNDDDEDGGDGDSGGGGTYRRKLRKRRSRRQSLPPQELPPLPPIALTANLRSPATAPPLTSKRLTRQKNDIIDYIPEEEHSDDFSNHVDFTPRPDPIFQTNFTRPKTSLTDKTTNTIEILPTVKENESEPIETDTIQSNYRNCFLTLNNK